MIQSFKNFALLLTHYRPILSKHPIFFVHFLFLIFLFLQFFFSCCCIVVVNCVFTREVARSLERDLKGRRSVRCVDFYQKLDLLGRSIFLSNGFVGFFFFLSKSGIEIRVRDVNLGCQVYRWELGEKVRERELRVSKESEKEETKREIVICKQNSLFQ